MNEAHKDLRTGGAGVGQRLVWCAALRRGSGRDGRLWPRRMRTGAPAWARRPTWAPQQGNTSGDDLLATQRHPFLQRSPGAIVTNQQPSRVLRSCPR